MLYPRSASHSINLWFASGSLGHLVFTFHILFVFNAKFGTSLSFPALSFTLKSPGTAMSMMEALEFCLSTTTISSFFGFNYSVSANIKIPEYLCAFILKNWRESAVIRFLASLKPTKCTQLPMNDRCHPVMLLFISTLDKLLTFTDKKMHIILIPTETHPTLIDFLSFIMQLYNF